MTNILDIQYNNINILSISYEKSQLNIPGLRFLMLNTTFNNISGSSWHFVLLLLETEIPADNYGHATTYRQITFHVVFSTIGN